jgi:hypothetical protein
LTNGGMETAPGPTGGRLQKTDGLKQFSAFSAAFGVLGRTGGAVVAGRLQRRSSNLAFAYLVYLLLYLLSAISQP